MSTSESGYENQGACVLDSPGGGRTRDSAESAALNFFTAATETKQVTGVPEREGKALEDDEDWLCGRFGANSACERVERVVFDVECHTSRGRLSML